MGVLVYGGSVSGVFILDDFGAIVDNGQIRQLWPPWDALSPPLDTPMGGRPVVNLSLAVNYALGTLDPLGYHVGNVVVHLLCVLVLFGIVRRTLLIANVRAYINASPEHVAFACALLWMVHPLQTEATNYVTQRTESIMALFYLLTLYCAIRGHGVRSMWWSIACITSCALGMASKEVMVTAPLVVLLYDRTFQSGSLSQALRDRWGLYTGLVFTWGVLVSLMWSSPRGTTVGFSSGVSAWTYLLNQSVAIVTYLRLTVWPFPLIVDYGVARPLAATTVAPYLALVAALVGATVAALRRCPMWGFLGAWVFVILAPTSSLVPIVSEVAAERRMYLPLAGISVLFVIASVVLSGRVTNRTQWEDPSGGGRRADQRSRWAAASLLVAVATALSLVTVNRHRDFRDPEQLWRTVVEHLPRNSRAHNNLGLALLERGAGDDAIAAFRRAVQINPVSFQANHNLGLELAKREQIQDAATFIEAALAAQPGHRLAPQAHNDLGVVLESQGKLDEADEHYRQAMLLDPNLGAAHVNSAHALQRQGQLVQAEQMFRRAVELDPNDVAAHHGLGEVLALTERFDEALASFRAAALLAPDAAITWSRMAEAIILSYQQTGTGDLDEATSFAERAAALTEFKNPALLLTLADTYGASGEFERAVETLEAALAAAAVGPATDELVTYLQERLSIYRTYEHASPGQR